MKPTTIGIHEARATLPLLVQRAAAGEMISLALHGRPQAKLVALDTPVKAARRFGLLKGRIKVLADFDTALPDDVLGTFESDL